MKDDEFMTQVLAYLQDRPFVLLFEGEDGLDRTVSNLSTEQIAMAYEIAAEDIRAGDVKHERRTDRHPRH